VGEGSVNERSDAVGPAVGEHVLLHLATEEVVRGLEGVQIDVPLQCLHLLGAVVGYAHVADRTLRHELVQDRPPVFGGGVASSGQWTW
jgi:hypothetical protein